MVAKCSNPPCNRQFRSLSKGRLFLLPPPVDSELMWKVDRLADHCYCCVRSVRWSTRLPEWDWN